MGNSTKLTQGKITKNNFPKKRLESGYWDCRFLEKPIPPNLEGIFKTLVTFFDNTVQFT